MGPALLPRGITLFDSRVCGVDLLLAHAPCRRGDRTPAAPPATEFILEEPIEGAIEIATDVYCIDGEHPSQGAFGAGDQGRGLRGEGSFI